MRRLMQLIFLSCVMMISTQCDREHNLDVVPPTPPTPPQTVDPPKEDDPTHEDDIPYEIWELTYDDYRVLIYRYDVDSIPQEYRDRKRMVKIIREGDELSVNGIFPEYPKAWIKFTVQGDSIYFQKAQFMGRGENRSKIYFRCSKAWWWSSITRYYYQMDFEIERNEAALMVSDDGYGMTAVNVPPRHTAFWYGNKEGSLSFWEGEDRYYDENGEPYWVQDGTGYPDTGFMVNMKFRKVSDTEDDTVNARQ